MFVLRKKKERNAKEWFKKPKVNNDITNIVFCISCKHVSQKENDKKSE